MFVNCLKPKKIFYRRAANSLTVFRAFIGLPLILFLSHEKILLAWIIVILAGISDALDGWFAKLAGGGTIWGSRLDPLADKILICAPIIWLNSKGILPSWSVWLLITRELLISAWRSEQKKGGPASLWGKSKTTLQFISILLMIWPNHVGGIQLATNLNLLGWLIFWPSLLVALSSGFKYINFQSNPNQN